MMSRLVWMFNQISFILNSLNQMQTTPTPSRKCQKDEHNLMNSPNYAHIHTGSYMLT